ncbi:hypothetical protein BDQ17DRAFT_1177470, partial [Cyathus striatus]
AAYGSGLRKFHVFCDVFSILEVDRLPASFELMHSFALWAASDLNRLPAVRKYLSAVRAWHIAQGWPPPLSSADSECIKWSLRGLQNLLGLHRRPLCPPFTIQMLKVLKSSLVLAQPYHACIWAAATCAFWGIMWFGEVTV